MESITRITLDYSDVQEAKVDIDFFKDDNGQVMYDACIHSIAFYRDSRAVIPMADALSVMNWLAGRVITWDAKTIQEEFDKWKLAIKAMKPASE